VLVHVRISWPVARQPFVYPARPVPRTAVLVPWFRPPSIRESNIRIFANGWSEQAARFNPAALAGTMEQLRALERLPLASLTHALIVLHPMNHPRLREVDRDWLWRVFGLPVFEQVIGPRGLVLATECEAHDGLHVESASGDLMLRDAVLNSSPCPCGRSSPRTASPPATQPLRKGAHAGR